MPRPLVNEERMTGAERQARYRAARMANGGTIPSPRPWSCGPSMPAGWTRCRTTNRTVRSPRPCERLLNSISPSFRRLSRQEASDVIEQRDGPYGMGHDDARGGGLRLPGIAGDRAVQVAVTVWNALLGVGSAHGATVSRDKVSCVFSCHLLH